jgi:hypothetical protein
VVFIFGDVFFSTGYHCHCWLGSVVGCRFFFFLSFSSRARAARGLIYPVMSCVGGRLGVLGCVPEGAGMGCAKLGGVIEIEPRFANAKAFYNVSVCCGLPLRLVSLTLISSRCRPVPFLVFPAAGGSTRAYLMLHPVRGC